MKKYNFVRINAVLIAILLIAAAFTLRLIVHTKTPSSPMLSGPDKSMGSVSVDTSPEPRVYDLNKLKDHNKTLDATQSIKIRPDETIETKVWRDADPNVKKEMIEGLDATIANSKKALETNPDDTMAKRILLASERRKKIEMENFEGNYMGKDVKIEEPDTPTAR
ncbi:MAG: hypothetical protein NT036_00460 [Candidatus Omnitrophica bacterium]|nr:hypothetical protein [Candidatus Omnitrophota bacterium]